jgi:hypothetical protein
LSKFILWPVSNRQKCWIYFTKEKFKSVEYIDQNGFIDPLKCLPFTKVLLIKLGNTFAGDKLKLHKKYKHLSYFCSCSICGDHRLIDYKLKFIYGHQKQLMAHLLMVSNLKNKTSGLSSKQEIGSSATCGNFRHIVHHTVLKK